MIPCCGFVLRSEGEMLTPFMSAADLIKLSVSEYLWWQINHLKLTLNMYKEWSWKKGNVLSICRVLYDAFYAYK